MKSITRDLCRFLCSRLCELISLLQMTRNYQKRLGAYGKSNYDPVYMERAVAAVKGGRMSIRKASTNYGVPYTTLNSHIHNKHPLKYGGQPSLDDAVENLLVDALQLCAEWGFPLKPIDVRRVVQQFLNRQGVTVKKFKDNLPGRDWFEHFMKRHEQLTVKLAENTKRVRAAVTYDMVDKYFQELANVVRDVPPENIVNYDETNFVDDPGACRVVLKKGTKHAYRTLDISKTNTTVMFAISADGTRLAPYVVYKAKYSYTGWEEGGLPGTVYNRSVRGWFDSELFEDWFHKIALPYFRRLDGPKVLIGDNLASHITVGVIQECQNNDIRFVLLPPNTTHMLQPLDVAYFRPLKGSWRKNLEQWKLRNRGVLPKTLFPRMLKQAVEDLQEREKVNICSGFRACGIVPFNPGAVLQKIKTKNRDTVTSSPSLESSMSEVLINHLDLLKTGESTAPKRGKKKNIIPGKMIGLDDLQETNKRKTVVQKRKRGNKSDSGEEQEIIEEVFVNSDSECGDEAQQDALNTGISPDDFEIGESSTAQTEPPPPDTQDFCVGDFVITAFQTNKRDRWYIGKVLEIIGSEVSVTMLRKGQFRKNAFYVYPNAEDIALVKKQQIMRKITLKEIKRGRHIFALEAQEEDLTE